MSSIFAFLFLLSILGFIISIFKPGLILRGSGRKKALNVFGGAIVLFFILTGITAPKVAQQEVKSEQKTVESTPTPNPSPTSTLMVTPTPTVLVTSSPTTKPSSTPKVTNTNTPTTLKSSDTSNSPQNSQPTGNFTCGSKRYCDDMSSCAEAQYYLKSCGLTRLDADSDGIPCESLCQ